MNKEKNWLYISLGLLIATLLSYLTPIVKYNGQPFGLLDMLGGDSFTNTALIYYTGPVLWEIDAAAVAAMTFLALAGTGAALYGILTLREQYSSFPQFVATIVGSVLTVFPALLILWAVTASQKYFPGELKVGAAPIIAPAAMLCCLIVVIKRRNYLKGKEGENDLIRMAGDL